MVAGGAKALGTQREGRKRDEHVVLQTWEHLTLLDGRPTGRGGTQETGVSGDTALIRKMQYTRLAEHQATLRHTNTHMCTQLRHMHLHTLMYIQFSSLLPTSKSYPIILEKVFLLCVIHL